MPKPRNRADWRRRRHHDAHADAHVAAGLGPARCIRGVACDRRRCPETARRVASNPRRSIEDARLKQLHHPGKQAFLDPGSAS